MFEGVEIAALTAPTLVGIAVMMLLTGRLVPRATLEDVRADALNWRTAYEQEREARTALQQQNGELLELAKTSTSVLTALGKTSEKLSQESQGSGGVH